MTGPPKRVAPDPLEPTAPRARPAVVAQAGAMIASLGRKIAAYPLLATGIAFGAGYALVRWVRR